MAPKRKYTFFGGRGSVWVSKRRAMTDFQFFFKFRFWIQIVNFNALRQKASYNLGMSRYFASLKAYSDSPLILVNQSMF